MFITDLPDDCLRIIFGLIYELDDLVNCFKVCNEWSYLVAERTKKVKYLIDEPLYVNVSQHVYYREKNPIDGSCLSTLFPNLKIAEFTAAFFKKVQREHIFTSVRNMNSLRGLILNNEYPFDDDDRKIVQCCDELEMVAVREIDVDTKEKGAKIKQLHLESSGLDYFSEDAHHFPNIERLHIFNNDGSPDDYYEGPVLSKLKIVELGLTYYMGSTVYYGLQFMDSCPNLQSAHIEMTTDRIYFDESVKNNCLQDLVLAGQLYHDEWNDFTRIFTKYPNLKHLSCWHRSLNNDQVAEMIRILPNLVLLDVRGCCRVTQDAAIYVKNYNKRYGRPIKFYFEGNKHEIISDWPQWSRKREKFSQGFDFMKHCFLKGFNSLSDFLIPIDDQ